MTKTKKKYSDTEAIKMAVKQKLISKEVGVSLLNEIKKNIPKLNKLRKTILAAVELGTMTEDEATFMWEDKGGYYNLEPNDLIVFQGNILGIVGPHGDVISK